MLAQHYHMSDDALSEGRITREEYVVEILRDLLLRSVGFTSLVDMVFEADRCEFHELRAAASVFQGDCREARARLVRAGIVHRFDEVEVNCGYTPLDLGTGFGNWMDVGPEVELQKREGYVDPFRVSVAK